ncbi:Methyl-accepting chemotaxis protein PctA [Planctomycetes bacterium MalM25]|nr:Methyl-accepting chemotaxis protein PctA [Planctomycetes bacterium MalM25]
MKIKTKLCLALALPAVGLLVLGGARIASDWREVNELHTVQNFADYGVRVSCLIHETQKERGATAGFLGSQGKKFGERLAEQRRLTDAQLAEYRAFLGACDVQAQGAEFAAAIERGSELLTSLEAIREAVDGLNVLAPQAIGYYTKVNAALLEANGKASAATSVGEITARIVSYNAFLKSKERAGIERAVLANTFAQDRFGPGMYEKFTSLVALQAAYLDEFKALATPDDLAFFAETLAAPCVEQVHGFRELAVSRSSEGGFGADAGVWFDTITKKINLLKQVDDELARRLKSHTAKLSASAAAALAWASVLVVSLIAAAAWIGVTSVRSTLRGLRLVTDRVNDIAEGEGDLTRRIEVTPDELGDLAGGFNAFMDKLEGTIRSISHAAHELSAESESLVATAGGMERDADTSRSQTNTIAAAAEEMSSTIRQIASSTDQLSGGIDHVSGSVGDISSAIDEVAARSSESADVANSVNRSVSLSSQRVRELGEAAADIDGVVNLIEEVAEQTNLLALNATIEAARAGEAGKGFAVVATEVKELAHQSAKATTGIRQRVSAMQSGAAETAEAIQDIESSIAQMTQLIAEIDASIHSQSEGVQAIANVMGDSASASAAISTSVHESAEASDEVARGALSIDQTVVETAGAAKRTNDSGRSVAAMAGTLTELTGQFRFRD